MVALIVEAIAVLIIALGPVEALIAMFRVMWAPFVAVVEGIPRFNAALVRLAACIVALFAAGCATRPPEMRIAQLDPGVGYRIETGLERAVAARTSRHQLNCCITSCGCEKAYATTTVRPTLRAPG